MIFVESLSKIMAMIIAVTLLFVYPAMASYDKQDDIAYIVAFTSVTNFVDSVRNKGYITPTMYNDFYEQLHSTGYVYDIQMEHLSKRYNPVYTDPANASTFQNKIDIDYEGFYTQEIMEYMFPNTIDPIDSPLRKYDLEVGDFISVTIKNINRPHSITMRDWLTFSNTGDNTRIYIPYGGMVHNEDY